MISAKVSGSAPTALPPRLNSRLNMSSQDLTGEVFQVAQTLVSLVMVPSQVSLVGSKLAALSSGSVAMPRLTVASVRPSFGAAPETYCVAFMLPAPAGGRLSGRGGWGGGRRGPAGTGRSNQPHKKAGRRRRRRSVRSKPRAAYAEPPA